MSTLVQSPEAVSSEISGLQAVAKPEKPRALGTFLNTILPLANEGLAAYDKGSRARLIALGQNDKLNGVMHEVSFLDRQNYRTGRTYQTIVNGQIALAQKFQSDIESADPASFDPEELLAKGRTYTDESVAIIHDSDLPDDLKEALYNSQLKENAAYMTMVDTKIKQITADNAASTRSNSTAELARNLGNSEWSVEELTVSVEAFMEKRKTQTRLAHPDMSAEEIDTQIQADLKAAFTFNMDSLKANGTPEDLQRLQYLSEVAESLVGVNLDLATSIQQKAGEFSADIQKNQVAKRGLEVQNFVDRYLYDSTPVDKDEMMVLAKSIRTDPSIPEVDRIRLTGQLLTAYAQRHSKIMNADMIIDPMSETPSSYASKGKTEAELVSDVTATLLQEHRDNPMVGGLAIMNHFSKVGAEYSPLGIKKGSEIFFGALTGYVKMSDSEAANDEYKDARSDSFNVAKMMYTKYKSENASKARDMLAGIDPAHMDAFTAAFETGGTLEDVRESFKNPVSTEQRYATMTEAINNTAGIEKELSLGSEVFGGLGGQFRNSMSDGVEPKFVNNVTVHLKGSMAHMLNGAQSSTAASVMTRYQQQGGFILSPNGYSAVSHDLGVAKQIQQYKVTGTNVPLPTQYMGRSYDAAKQRWAKEYNVSPSNVIATSDATGQLMYFDIYKSTGWNGKGEPEFMGRKGETMVRLKNDAEALYHRDSQRRASPAGQDEAAMNTKVGEAVTNDITGQRTNVKLNAMYAKGFGGNPMLATRWVNHMQQMEGFTSKGTTAKDANTGKVSEVFGHGMTSATLKKFGMLEEVQAARGNPQAMMDVQGKFMQKYYINAHKSLANVGLPQPTNAMYPAQHAPALMLVYDVLWHGGSTGRVKLKNGKYRQGLEDAMNAKSYAEGRKILQGLPTYNRKTLGSKRNRFMESALLAHYQARGLK